MSHGREAPSPADLVQLYLRAQNHEQIREVDEAIRLYEQAVDSRFDAAGPYDRLIYLYREREAHADVARVAEAALSHVRTFADKLAWYEEMRTNAREAHERQPDPRGSEF